MRSLTWRQLGLIGTFTAASMLALLAGCSGGGGGEASPSPTPVCSPIAPMLSVLQAQIFTPSCSVGGSSCHSGLAPTQGFNTSTPATLLMTSTNVTAVETFNSMPVIRIVPGNHASSYVWMKVAGTVGIEPVRMPQTAQYLNSCQIDAIAAWIDAGAQNN